MHPRLTVNSLSTASWTLEQDLELYDALGVTSAAWYADKLERAGLGRAVELIRDSGIRSAQVFTRGFTLHDASTWPGDRDRLRAAIDAATALDAPWLGLTAGPAGGLSWDDAAAALGRAVEPLRDLGVGIAVEHSLPIRVEIGFVHSLRDCMALAERLDLGVTMEGNYCFAERGLDDTVRGGVDRLAAVQLSDLVTPSTTLPDRAVPGDGVIDLAALVGLVVDAGYTGQFELEMLGPRIEAEGYASAVRRAVDVLEGILEQVVA